MSELAEKLRDIQAKPVESKRDLFLQDVLQGLKAKNKCLSPKYFYDVSGSKLFDEICSLKEYYPYLTELKLLDVVAKELDLFFEMPLNVVEFGAGSLVKIQPLLKAIKNIDFYMPIDISGEWMEDACQELNRKFPDVEMLPIAGDFNADLYLPNTRAKKIGFFPGSTIGNFTPVEAKSFLSNAKKTLGEASYLLIGVDTKKNANVLHRAYNDSIGITAKFNLNLLERINRELNANIDTDKFDHYAFYNVAEGRVEMHLISTEQQSFFIENEVIDFQQGETIHTENSYKYSPVEFESLAADSGWKPLKVWMDDENLFSIFLLQT